MPDPTMTRPESETKIATMFDKVAPKYDFLNSLLSLRQDQRWRKALIAKLPPAKQNGQILDVACGTGDVILQAYKTRFQDNPKLAFVGVDISQGMLQLAEQKCAVIPRDRVRFKQMSAMDLRLSDGSFSAVTIAFGLRNVVDKDQALKEFLRVLQPGGTLLILEFFAPDHSLLAWLFQWYFHHILPKIGGLFSDREAYHYLPQSVSSFYSPEALKNKLAETGFISQEWRSFVFGSCRLVKASRPT